MYSSILSWVATILVLGGFAANSFEKRKLSFILWIIGDILWIIFDIWFITNPAHAALSFVIIIMNITGMIKITKQHGKN